MANKPSSLTGGAGPAGHLSSKRGTEDLDYYIGDEALAAAGGPGKYQKEWHCGASLTHDRLWYSLSNPAWTDRKLGQSKDTLNYCLHCPHRSLTGSYGALLVKFNIQIPTR